MSMPTLSQSPSDFKLDMTLLYDDASPSDETWLTAYTVRQEPGVTNIYTGLPFWSTPISDILG